jgi:glucose/arabinose dehydrogenase
MFRAVMRWWAIGGVAALCAVGVACGGDSGNGDEGAMITGITLDEAFNGRDFNFPVKLVQHPTDDERWYVVEQSGLIRRFTESGTSVSTAANIPAQAGVSVGCSPTNCATEQGLLGMAFDPFFDSSGEMYVFYTDSDDESLVVQRWQSSNDGDTFTPGTVILRIPHPNQTNHNGGDLAFGTNDDFLYISTGDGGGAGDPDRNAQDRSVLLGKVLRLDVNATPPAGKTYAIPGGNPFAGQTQCDTHVPSRTASCPEIFAFGFRNPWRMNFDPNTGELFLGDVGQGAQEEIDLVENGDNYGWDCFEGEQPFENVTACNSETFTAPEFAYDARAGSGNAVTGGAVYRGTVIPGLRGLYLFTDYFYGPIRAFDTSVPDAPVQDTSASETGISAFGQGRDGEVYPVDHDDGRILKIVPSPG